MKIRENMLLKFMYGNRVAFWREIRKINGISLNNSSYIDGYSDPVDVVSVFDRKYREILDDRNCQLNSSNYSHNRIHSPDSSENVIPLITINNVKDAILRLSVGGGWDKIHSYHLKYSGPIFKNLLCKIFNSFLTHNYVPKSLMVGKIKPVAKNCFASKFKSSNYRPVMNSSNLLKVFEYCLLPFLEKHLGH